MAASRAIAPKPSSSPTLRARALRPGDSSKRLPATSRSRCSRRSTPWVSRCSSGSPEVAEITLVLPNQHHLLVNLAPFGLDNPNRVFVGTDEPFGQIEATIAR